MQQPWHRARTLKTIGIEGLCGQIARLFLYARAAQSEPYHSSEDFDEAFESMTATLNPESLTPPIEAIAVDITLHQIERLDLTQNETPHREPVFAD